MPLIETHAHLDDPRFAEDQDAVIARAHDAGVTRIITIGTDLESSRAALALADRYASVYAAVGVHPGYVAQEGLNFLEELRSLALHPKVVALGEIGIDYFHLPSNCTETAKNSVASVLAPSSTSCTLLRCAPSAPSFSSASANFKASVSLTTWRKNQQEAFDKQLALALELGLNVIIHQRDLPIAQKNVGDPDAWKDTLEILKPYTGKVRGVFHCFGGAPDQALEIAALGHLVSFTGIITFKNAPIVRETAAAVAADGYMVETDCPYLAPMPHRGERAEPAYTRLVAQAVAKARGISLEEVAEATTATAEKFFRFKASSR